MKKLLTYLSLAFALASATGCSTPQPVRCTGPEDTPIHHYLRGMEALDNGRMETAREKFDRALYCDENFTLAHGGLAIVSAERAKTQGDEAFRRIEAERALGELAKAEKGVTPEEKFDVSLAALRTFTILQTDGWLRQAEEAHEEALLLKVDERKLLYYQGREAAHYFLGLSYLQSLEFQRARDRFADVLNARSEGKWHSRADSMWKRTDRVVRAIAGVTVGDVGKTIAVKDTISRGDLAALLVDELKIDKLFATRIPASSLETKAEFVPADIVNHPFKEEILAVLKWKVRGMEPKYSDTSKAYLFVPADAVTRGEMAFVLEDVLLKIIGNDKLASAYFGHDNSPFPDVRPTSPLYNAVMNVATRAIMEAELSGEFRVNAPVTGAEAILAMRQLKLRMNIY